jgi:hypothetical protein
LGEAHDASAAVIEHQDEMDANTDRLTYQSSRGAPALKVERCPFDFKTAKWKVPQNKVGAH